MAEQIDLSVVIPARNEEGRLGASLPRILEYLDSRRRPYEVLVVDDGSSDGTAGVAERLSGRPVRLLRHPRQMGKGAAFGTGVGASRGEWVLLTDADLSTPIEELARLESRRGSASVVVGSRAVRGARIEPRQPLFRELLGKGFNLVVRLLRLTDLRDTQCGFKLLHGDLARRFAAELEIRGFAFDVELLWRLRRSGERIEEVGVRWGHSHPSAVHPLRESYRMLRDVLLFRCSTLLESSTGSRPRRGTG